ncbi:MAG: adenosine deaminase [Spirochaetes bacterium]|nr:adenosine deaminase [Spirochaetota bacterium]
MNKTTFKYLLSKIPKTEIHLHSEALISRETVFNILSRKYPKYQDFNEVEKLFDYKSLSEFIEVFLLIQSAFEKDSDFEQLFKNILPYLKRNGIVHAELFFSPSNFTRNGIEFENMIKVFLKEIELIKNKENIDIKIIIDVSRTFGIENAMRNLDAAIKCKSSDIIGIGLGGDEKKGPAKDYESVFKKAKEHGLHRVVHAGEDVDSYSIWDAIKYLEAERIGHGISAINDKELMVYLKEKKIPLEICPTSNVFTKGYIKEIEEHPIKKFYQKNVIVTLNTDDPVFFNVELLDEYWNLYTKLKFSMNDIKNIIINGFNSSFMSEEKKKEYIKEINILWSKYFKNYN